MQPFLKPEIHSAEFTSQMDVLYSAAAVAYVEYKRVLTELLGDPAKNIKGTAKIPGLKGRKTAEDKLLRGGGERKPPATLTDIVRGTLVFEDHDSLFKASRALQAAGLVFSMKDRFHASADEAG